MLETLLFGSGVFGIIFAIILLCIALAPLFIWDHLKGLNKRIDNMAKTNEDMFIDLIARIDPEEEQLKKHNLYTARRTAFEEKRARLKEEQDEEYRLNVQLARQKEKEKAKNDKQKIDVECPQCGAVQRLVYGKIKEAVFCDRCKHSFRVTKE